MEEGKVSPLHIDNFCEKLFYNYIMCVNGLFCCSMRNVDGVAICNPSTKVVRSLPRLKECPKIDYAEYFCSMGFDPEEKTYKVLMTINGFTKPTRNWVFTLGRDEESWREIKGKEEWEKHMIEIPAASPEFKRLTFCGTCDGEILFTNKLASVSFSVPRTGSDARYFCPDARVLS
ncbi:hypothetical protein KY289_020955 [Solanum tuberosum]|nr:hypothetical protein KY289_020955 [Solanum tuberosum]